MLRLRNAGESDVPAIFELIGNWPTTSACAGK